MQSIRVAGDMSSRFAVTPTHFKRTPLQAETKRQQEAKRQREAEAERIMNNSAADAVILFRDIVTPATEALRVDPLCGELHLRFQAVQIDRSPALPPAVMHILNAKTYKETMGGILSWVRENRDAHAVKLFDIYDNLYCIMRTGVKNRELPPSLRLSCADAGEGAFLNETDTRNMVERYLYFLDTFWLPLVAKEDATVKPILRLLETKQDVGYETTTSAAVYCMKHGLGRFDIPAAAQRFMCD